MGNIPEKRLAGSVSRSVYSLFQGGRRKIFEHQAGRLRTVFVRIAAAVEPRR